MSRLIFDIETVGEDFDSMDSQTQDVLTRWIRENTETEEEFSYELDKVKKRLGFSPYTAEIVVLGVYDYDKDKGAVYFQAPGETGETFEEGNIKFEQMTEKEMLVKFWAGAENYTEFVTFNGRSFDVPFLTIRSAVHHVRPTKNLMSSLYIERQQYGPVHVDLQDQFTFYGAMRHKGGLHLITGALAMEGRKQEGISGEDVGRLFEEKRYLDIAKYNVRDLIATKELYDYWSDYM